MGQTLAFCVTLKLKRREFQYKILNCIVCMNLKLYLYRYGLSTSNPTFCHETAESIWHLFYFCKLSSNFWRHVLSWLFVLEYNLVPRSHSVTGNVRSGKVRFRAWSVPARPEIRAFLSLRMFVLSVVILGDFAE